jgi:hypothetical protein
MSCDEATQYYAQYFSAQTATQVYAQWYIEASTECAQILSGTLGPTQGFGATDCFMFPPVYNSPTFEKTP